MNVKRLIPYLTAAIVFSWAIAIFFSSPKAIKTEPSMGALTHQYQMSDLSIVQFDKNGQRIHTIYAEKAETINDLTTLTAPTIETRVDDNRWKMSAGSAKSNDNFLSLSLTQQVTIDESSEATKLSFVTNELHYDARKKLLSTEAPVVINNGGFELSGVGLSVNLANQGYEIKSQVKGQEAQ